ncbi:MULTISPECIES: MFS transporter [unclassified Pseudoclavibacter]|uniref:MFS transporter n=1 Tax=unclassified Pseudoclavibacter TaxID=2615177 RepID=UPI001BA7B775|nr:MFS transporter [Pseudoclavibacter sp. Marseille-Q4354]MBS3177361.1 MFS transporter [Pseudoclavibacter sp. Marseille-Q4354]
MRDLLENRAFRHLFGAQVVALVGTGLLTVALGLLAFDLAGGDAGIVLGTALTIKMIAYVVVSPVMAAVTSRWSRRRVLISADLIRAAIALGLPFVGEVWQVYLLIFVLQAASATFTPTFQAVIPDVLPDERRYTRALSLSRLAYDLEALASPVLAALLLTVVTYNSLFVGTVVGFLVSATLVAATRFPSVALAAPSPFLARLTAGIRVFWRSRDLRALLALNLAVAAGTAMVIVNSVVLVQAQLGRPQSDLAVLLACSGAGSMLVALGLPRVLERVSDRRVMLAGAALVPVSLLAAAGALSTSSELGWMLALPVWALLGAATSLVLTPSSRLLRRAASSDERPAVFAAQFSLSHACYILCYPAAGFLGAWLGLAPTAVVLGGVSLVATVVAALTWAGRGAHDRRPEPAQV